MKLKFLEIFIREAKMRGADEKSQIAHCSPMYELYSINIGNKIYLNATEKSEDIKDKKGNIIRTDEYVEIVINHRDTIKYYE